YMPSYKKYTTNKAKHKKKHKKKHKHFICIYIYITIYYLNKIILMITYCLRKQFREIFLLALPPKNSFKLSSQKQTTSFLLCKFRRFRN
nr:hypothetical ORF-9 protein - Leishmania tarentolae mitochondrion [Leishmania tarentolae]